MKMSLKDERILKKEFDFWKERGEKPHIFKKNMSFLKVIHSEFRLQFRGGQSLGRPIRFVSS